MSIQNSDPRLGPIRSTSATPALERALTMSEGRATVTDDWFSWTGLQGGLLAALCLRAAVTALDADLAPRSLTAQFLAPAAAGDLQLTIETVRAGGSSAVVAVSAGTAARASVVAGRSRGVSTLTSVTAPVVQAPEDCPDLELPLDFVPFSQHLHFRPATAARPLAGGDQAELIAWVRFADDTVTDAAALCVLVDAMPPALYGATATPVAIPTVDLMVTFTGAHPPEPQAREWLLVRISTRTAAAGWCVDDSDVWNRDGQLLASARQTRRVLGEWSDDG